MSKLLMRLTPVLLVVGMPQLLLPAHIVQHNLVSDVPGLADHTDPNLVNSWGITRGPSTPWWVADNGTGVSTLYTGAGEPIPLVVVIPTPSGTGTSTPTGTVFNGTSDFMVSGKPSFFLFVTEGGTLAAWAPMVSFTQATIKVDNSSSGAVYKGMTMGQQGGANRLYIANFHSGAVEVYDGSFHPVTLSAGAFTDPKLPPGFAPFNVLNIGGQIFVAFAKQDVDRHDEVDGAGLGFVDSFDPWGNLVMRLEHGKWMNAPWGMTHAPANFGPWSNRLLVGQFGSGQIASFDPENGEFEGLLRGPHGKPIQIDGLWGLAFGNDGAAGPSNTLFFTAGINHEQDGLFGTLVPDKLNGDDEEEDE